MINKENRSLIINAVLNELKEPQLKETEYFFSVNKLHSTKPIADIVKKNNFVHVYVNVEFYYYYWCIYFECVGDCFQLKGGYSWPHANIYAVIYSDDIHPDLITNKLGIQPTRVAIKNAPIRLGSKSLAKNHRWYYTPKCNESAEFETKIHELLKVLSPSAKQLKELSKTCKVNIGGAFYEQPNRSSGFGFSQRLVQNLAAIGASFDIDLYSDGPIVPEDQD